MRKTLFLKAIAAGVVVTMAAGCTTINPYTRETQTSKATKGAAIGAATGAAIGLLTGGSGRNRRKNALIGAGVGALTGGGIGYYMDVQEAKLRQKLEGTGVSVSRVGDNIILNMPSNVTYKFGSADLKPEFFSVLESVALVANEYPKTLIDVAGHTDSVGSDDFNQGLSERRAQTVASYLVSQNVAQMRFDVSGYGERHPIASNDSDGGRAQNRRVELALIPLTQ